MTKFLYRADEGQYFNLTSQPKVQNNGYLDRQASLVDEFAQKIVPELPNDDERLGYKHGDSKLTKHYYKDNLTSQNQIISKLNKF